MINYFQATQTALFYKKNKFEMFKPYLNIFLDLRGSCGQNKIKANKAKAISTELMELNWK